MQEIDLLSPENAFTIGGIIHNKREREYNGNVTVYLMIESKRTLDDGREFFDYYEVEFYGDKAGQAHAINVGDFASFKVNLGGRKWQDKNTGEIKGAFFSFKGWGVKDHKPATAPTAADYQNVGKPSPDLPTFNEGDDDIPF